MADENDDTDNNENEEGEGQKSPASGKKKLIIIILIGVLVLAASVVGTLWMLGVFDSDEEEVVEGEATEEMAAEEQAAASKPSPAMYFPIKPAFVVNFSSRGRQRYLQADVTIMTRDPDVFTALQTHLPLVKNRLVMLFSGQVYEELQTDEGKELLRQQSQEALQELLQQELGKGEVEEVLFTNFVMQ